jgi:hypothetical protein
VELDELKKLWLAHGATMERSLAIGERLLRETMLGKTRRALAPYILWRALEVVLGMVMLWLMAPVIAAHVTEPRYVLVAGLALVFVAGMTAVSGLLLARAASIDYRATVTALQRDLEHLKLVEVRTTKWAVLGGIVVWLPAALVVFEAVTGVAVLAHVELAWLLANLALGATVGIAGMAWANRRQGSLYIADVLSGRSIQRAEQHLAELAQFVREPQ